MAAITLMDETFADNVLSVTFFFVTSQRAVSTTLLVP